MAEAVEVVGQIMEDRGHTHKFYAPDSSSDEELEVCCRDLKEKLLYIFFIHPTYVLMYTFVKNRSARENRLKVVLFERSPTVI